MDRNYVIVLMKPLVETIVRKCNNYKNDEDLTSIGMIAVIECVDRCYAEGVMNINDVRKRCGVWAKNRILDTLKRKKFNYVDEYEELNGDYDIYPLCLECVEVLTPRELEFFKHLLVRNDKEYLMEHMKISQTMYYKYLKSIKNKINGVIYG